jgi:biotin-dependent carboxylase-like uncharacterized protein
MSGFEVVQPGALTLLQDGGRAHVQHLGVSPSGPVDMQAAAWANRLLGNRWGTALLEVALGGLSLRCACDTWVAVCGADMPILLDGVPQQNWSRFAVRTGQQLQLGYARSGQRAYLAVCGGFVADARLGSVATQQREGIGGLRGDGSPLRNGDLLPCVGQQRVRVQSVPAAFRPDYQQEPCLRLIVGGDAQSFGESELNTFLIQRWHVSPQSDRMGARLQGTPLRLPALPAARQWSQGVSNGAVQVPPDGQPIVLLADRQSMGGYPLLGWVHPLDLGRLAQCPAQHSVQFGAVSQAAVQAELLRFYRFFGR